MLFKCIHRKVLTWTYVKTDAEHEKRRVATAVKKLATTRHALVRHTPKCWFCVSVDLMI